MEPKFTSSSASLSTEVELSISCRSLPKMDILSMSDPMCVTYMRPFGENRFVEYHRTEAITNSHDPDFASKVVLEYKFEEQQFLEFQVYDVDSDSARLSDHDFIGSASCTLGQIVSSETLKLPLTRDKQNDGGLNYGYILLTAEELSSNRDEVTMRFSGHDLARKAFFGWGLSDPFLKIFKSTNNVDGGDSYILVHKTEVKKWNLNPRWDRFTIPIRTLCNGDFNRKLKFVCLDHRMSGYHSLIGEFETTLQVLREGPGNLNQYSCINPNQKLQKGDAYKNSGIITLDYFEHHEHHSFLDYIKGGTKLHCTVAIDFTGSNGDPTKPTSLHYISSSGMNSYERAIVEVGDIIEDYDSDKLFPVLGFGARLPHKEIVSHEFYVNMRTDNPFCAGVKGVLDAYHNCVRLVELFGPTCFAPVINHVANFASSYRNNQGTDYFILLILTDGVINDMRETTKAIVAASVLPLSIIIVGIGEADFTAMEILDGDTVALSSGGVKAARDIVQFVPFKNFSDERDSSSATKRKLAREVLAEIPNQLISYMKTNNILPASSADKQPVVLPPDPVYL